MMLYVQEDYTTRKDNA